MISQVEIGKLARVQATEPVVLSLLSVPLAPAELRELPARAAGLIAAAAGGPGHGGRKRVRDADRGAVRSAVAAHGRDWLGRTVAIFACADQGLFEVLPLSGEVADRAVLAARPHIRPLLADLQRRPAYRVAVVDRRHAWVLTFADGEIQAVAAPDAATVASPGFGGWYGLDAYHVQHRISELARHHYRQVAALLEHLMRDGEPEPLVIGGHEDGIGQLFGSLQPAVRKVFAGSFIADPRALTPARVRDLAEPVIARWAEQEAQRLATQVLETPPGGLAAVGLADCVAAVNAHAVGKLIVASDGLVPGYVCGRCGLLGTAADGCPHWEAAAEPVPDLIDEMVHRTLDDGGQITAIRSAPFRIAARLRFPVTGP
jgi:peptide chain release factor subunit 1